VALNAASISRWPRTGCSTSTSEELFLRPDVDVDTAVGRIGATAHLDPWIFGVGVRYRF